MAFKMACKDLGVDCGYTAYGNTEEELMSDVVKHAKKVHKYTDEQINDPEMMKKVKSAIKKY